MDGFREYVKSHVEKNEVVALPDYLAKVKSTPSLAAGAHRRVYDMIKSHGVDVDPETGEETYLFFKRELFGIEKPCREIMEYFKGAALGSDVSKRFLLIFGPPSSGKSCLVDMLKAAIEAWTKTDAGTLYAIDGCPMNEEPLHLVPRDMRAEVEAELGVKIEGELCPLCAHRLRHEMNGDFTKFKARRVYFSQQARIGVGVFCPSDPKSQDISELIGSVDLSKVGEYGTESDPRAYKFDGELNIANRGIMEFLEILKCDIKFLYVLLTATQEKNIKTPRFPLISCDEVILSHTNESEYKEFMGNPKNEALIDRMIVCRVPYNLKVNDEVKIYEKLLKAGKLDIHIAPHSLKVAAMFGILSRVSDPKDQNMDKVKKMKLYNGDDVEGYNQKDISRLLKESQTDGMDGVSPRYIINRIITTAIRGPEQSDGKDAPKVDKSSVDGLTGRKYITPINVLLALRDGLVTSSKFGPEERSKYEDLVMLVRKEYDQIALNEVQKAFFISFESEAMVLLDNYMKNVEAYLEKTKVEDPLTGEEIDPSENLMRSIETKIGVTDSAKESFRQEIMRKMAMALKKREDFRYDTHARLRDAIEKQLFEERRDVIKMTVTSRTKKDPEELKRINQVIRTLCDKYGYIPESANDLLNYVSHVMAKSEKK
jgi:serine protein kinase